MAVSLPGTSLVLAKAAKCMLMATCTVLPAVKMKVQTKMNLGSSWRMK